MYVLIYYFLNPTREEFLFNWIGLYKYAREGIETQDSWNFFFSHVKEVRIQAQIYEIHKTHT